MKITKNWSWQTVTTTVSQFWPLRQDTKNDVAKNKEASLKRFTFFGSDLFKPFSLPAWQDIDLNLLEQFVANNMHKEISYQNLIASHLQHDALDAKSNTLMKRTLAKKKMFLLVNTTVADMKRIVSNHISQHKG